LKAGQDSGSASKEYVSTKGHQVYQAAEDGKKTSHGAIPSEARVIVA